MLAIAAGFAFAGFQTANRRANQVIDAYRGTFLILAVGLVGLTAIVLFTQDLHVIVGAPITAYLAFAAAGIVHFFFGWTFLALSQQRIGAARSGAISASAPLFAAIVAALALSEPLTVPVLVGVLLVVAGVAALSMGRGVEEAGKLMPWFGLAAALSWGISPLFIRWGLARLDVPLIGVTFGVLAATVTYGIALTVTGRLRQESIPRAAVPWMVAAGVFVATGITLQWTAYDLITIAPALTLMQISSPVVIVVAPLVVGTAVEKPTPLMILGAAAIIAGSVVVIAA